MTQDEIFTAIYLVCGSLPSEPDSQPDERSYSTRYRRKLANGREIHWMVDRDAENDLVYRSITDPAYGEYYDKACEIHPITREEFADYIRWLEDEQRGQKI